MTEQKTYCFTTGEQLPDNVPAGTRAINVDTAAEFIFILGRWQPYGIMAGIRTTMNADGTTTLIVENLEVSGSFTADEVYYQNLNGVNGALFVAPSGRVRNFAWMVDHLPPSGILRDVDYITDRGAVFNGIVEPEGEDGVFYFFEYGPSLPEAYTPAAAPAFGNTTQRRAIAGKTPITVKEPIAWLQPKKQYGVRLNVVTKTGTYKTNAVKFTTLALKGSSDITPITGDANPVSQYAATMHGTVKPLGLTLTYFFKIWTAAGAYQVKTDTASVPAQTTANVSALITGLKAGTAYYASLCVTDPAGTVHEGAAVQFSTAPIVIEAEEFAAPAAGTVTMTSIEDEAASAKALIAPAGLFIEYQFEYWRTPTTVFRTPRIQTHAAAAFYATADFTAGLHSGRDYYIQLAIFYTDANADQIKLTGGTTQFTTTG